MIANPRQQSLSQTDCSPHKAAATTLAIAAACIAALAACGLLAGCNSASASVDRIDYSTALNRYYEGRPGCLWSENIKFPANAPTAEQQRTFNALVDSGLLVRKRSGRVTQPAAYTYDLSPEGRSAFDRDIENPGAGNFCYGRRKVVGIDHDRKNSTTTQLVDFRYTIPRPASWATEISIQRAFPQVAAELSGPHHAQVKLLDTTTGWEVASAPVSLAPAPPPHSSSTLARAKNLLRMNKKQSS